MTISRVWQWENVAEAESGQEHGCPEKLGYVKVYGDEDAIMNYDKVTFESDQRN